jgi:PQQ-like domain
MRRLGMLIILGLLVIAGQIPARAAASTSDWPSLNADAAQSNSNPSEQILAKRNVLKLKGKWAVSVPDISYPVVAGGRVYVPVLGQGKVHVRALDALSGKQVELYTKDAVGGILARGATLYLAGHILQAVDVSTGTKLGQINAAPRVKNGSFLDPVGDDKVIVAGYAGTTQTASNSLYVVDPGANSLLWKEPSLSAASAIGTGRIVTRIDTGSAFYDESSGQRVASATAVYSDWFAGQNLAYTVASLRRKGGRLKNATLYAYDGAGNQVWHRAVGPPLLTIGWPHALNSQAIYLDTLTPGHIGIQALDPLSGDALWFRQVADVQRLAVANHVLFALTYRLGLPVRLVAFNADTGAVIGAINLPITYTAFPAANGLMVADGMVFIRTQGTGGSQLVALGL